MQHFDLSPLYRASIGFDQVSDLMNRVISTNSTTTSYPPYDIEKTADDSYRISIAVAGFSDADLNCLLYTSPSPRDQRGSRMPSSA